MESYIVTEDQHLQWRRQTAVQSTYQRRITLQDRSSKVTMKDYFTLEHPILCHILEEHTGFHMDGKLHLFYSNIQIEVSRGTFKMSNTSPQLAMEILRSAPFIHTLSWTIWDHCMSKKRD